MTNKRQQHAGLGSQQASMITAALCGPWLQVPADDQDRAIAVMPTTLSRAAGDDRDNALDTAMPTTLAHTATPETTTLSGSVAVTQTTLSRAAGDDRDNALDTAMPTTLAHTATPETTTLSGSVAVTQTTLSRAAGDDRDNALDTVAVMPTTLAHTPSACCGIAPPSLCSLIVLTVAKAGSGIVGVTIVDVGPRQQLLLSSLSFFQCLHNGFYHKVNTCTVASVSTLFMAIHLNGYCQESCWIRLYGLTFISEEFS